VARDVVDEMKKGELVENKKLKGLMELFHDNIKKAIFTERFQPLHRQIKNLYKQNKSY
jgi:hypothetical protein